MVGTDVPTLRVAQNIVNREWAEHITVSERAVLLWILDRTIGFKKISEVIPYRHFHDGIVSAAGERICFGVGLGRGTLYRVLASLRAKRLLSVTGPGNTAKRFEVLLDETPATNVRGASQFGTLVSQTGTPVSQTGTLPRVRAFPKPSILTKEINMRISNCPTGRSAQGVVERISQVSSRTAEAHSVKLAKGGADALLRYYQDQMVEYWPKAPLPGFRAMDRVKFKQAFLHGTGYDPKEYIHWCVSEWGNILNRVFGNTKRRTPVFPDLGFLSVYRTMFMSDYASAALGMNARSEQAAVAATSKFQETGGYQRIEELEKQVQKLKARNFELEGENEMLNRKVLLGR